MSRRVDLDARHKQLEAEGQAVEVVLGGEVYLLPPELPLAVAEALVKDDLDGLVGSLFPEEAREKVKGLLLTGDLELLAELYGTGLGESEASDDS